MLITLIIVFILTRFYTANPDPVWFDSLEYLVRLASSNYWNALSTGHLPLHAGYILLFKNLPLIPAQIILGLGGLISFYKLTRSKTAVLIVSLLPLAWLSQTTVVMEAAYVPLFLISLYMFKSKRYWVASVLFGLGLLTHLAVLLWIPLIIYYNKKSFIYLFISVLIASLFNAYLISPNIFVGLKEVYLSKVGEHVQFTNIFVLFRNFIIPLLRNNTNLIVILASISLLRRPKLALWILPAIITNQWWDSLFFGRHALIASYGLSLLAAQLIQKHRLGKAVVIAYLILTVVPTVAGIRKPIPYLEIIKQIKILSQNGTLIDSHFARPQTQGVYLGKTIYVNEPGWQLDLNNPPIFITKSALSDPYGLYSGPFLHSLSLSYKNPPTLSNKLSDYFFTEVSTDIYKLTPSGQTYPLENLYYSPSRLDYHDPLTQIWFAIQKIFI